MTRPAKADPPDPQPFARLVQELHDLGFEKAVTDTADTVYTATDSEDTVTIVNRTAPSRARICGGHAAAWTITVTATVAHPTQLICLYAALNDDPTAALQAAAAAIGIDAPTGGTEPSHTAG